MDALEEAKKKTLRDMEVMQQRIDSLEAEGDKNIKSKKKLQAELEDYTVELESTRSSFTALEKRQRKFDQNLAEEKAISERLAMERDNAERESREKETRILNQARELEELRDRCEEVERLRGQQSRELEDLMSSKDDVGKNVRTLASLQLKHKKEIEIILALNFLR